jgi:thiol-disulfide isomerase/thioredoxin
MDDEEKPPSPRDPAREKLKAVLNGKPSLSELRGAIEGAKVNGLDEEDLADAQQLLDEKLQMETEHLEEVMGGEPTTKALELAIAHAEHVGASATVIATAKVQLARIKLFAASPLIKDVKEFQAAIRAAKFAGVEDTTIKEARKALDARKKLRVELESNPTVRILHYCIEGAKQSGHICEQDIEAAHQQMIDTAIKKCADAFTFRDELLAAGDQLVIVHFYAHWSFPCQMVEKDFLELALELGRRDCRTVFIEIDVDVNLSVLEKYEVLAFPTFRFFKAAEVIMDKGGPAQPPQPITVTGADVDRVRSIIAEQAPGGLEGMAPANVSGAGLQVPPRPPTAVSQISETFSDQGSATQDEGSLEAREQAERELLEYGQGQQMAAIPIEEMQPVAEDAEFVPPPPPGPPPPDGPPPED